MEDFIYRNVGWIVTIVCIILFLVIGALAHKEQQETARLINQCMADGKKEYECMAMFKQEGPQPYPVVIPMVIR